ncbi:MULTISPECIES: cellulose-binding domain-containing protein [unclassified Streptomyces]|uniref:cellulose-binding domain-containing protein n=1 Tax=unclassified Streptomyces TaxID=2593676 RepID=UPI002E80F81D|nr:cellulose-binding domain-containing protein [Streptomyces sp. NBC_00589]WTI35330.1 cellulose-binding domain-containing protein [Streptomyces sp. NBC_00775]WUB30996.1 cellulose-binding domain-containing protein [Streptomyces sp. NBC_00589]
MPDLPTPQDAAEAALFSECWDAVLSYADLCTSGSAAASQLATEAFTHGIQEARAAAEGTKSTGRRTPRLPRIPLLLTSVRTTAAAWEAHGQGHRLDPDLRLWLHSEKAARYTGPPLHRPLALRGLRDMQEPDAALLWLAEVEALPLPAVARRLGLDPAAAAEELAQVRALFRDRCHRNHLDTPMDANCRSYARLLDAVTRSPGAETPEDLSRHLARCVECAEAAACLRLHGGGLPSALAGGVIGWGGLAYLERRRRAAEAGLAGGRTDATVDTGLAEGKVTGPRIGRTGVLVAAVIVSALALTVSLMPFDGAGDGSVDARGDSADRQPVADPGVSPPSSPSATARPAGTLVSPEPSESANGSETNPDPEPQGTSTSPAQGTDDSADPTHSASSSCEVTYEIVNQWPDGFQASVTVTSAKALDGWSVAWTFHDGQRVSQMWDGTFVQNDSRVTATAADYNKSVAAGGTFAVGFIASWHDGNSVPKNFSLNGGSCTSAG